MIDKSIIDRWMDKGGGRKVYFEELAHVTVVAHKSDIGRGSQPAGGNKS